MSDHWISPFLEQLTATGNVSGSARSAGITSTTAYTRRREDADFKAAWDQSLEDASDELESEARRRAVKGVQKPVVYQGELTPVWARSADGRVLQEEYEERVLVESKWTLRKAYRNVQALDPNGHPLWLTITEYSDPLLALLLKGRRKQVFADRTEITGADGGEVKVMDSTARAARIAFLMAQAADRANFKDLA